MEAIPVIVRCGRLFDGASDRLRSNAIVQIVGDRITAVADDDGDARNAGAVLDWRDWTVLPGLVDAHDHLTLDVGDEEAQSREGAVRTAFRSAGNALQTLRAGVTTVRDCGAKGHVDLELRAALAAGVVEGPRLLVSGVPLTTPRGQCWFLGGEVATVDDARRLIHREAEAGVDFIKVFVTGGVATRGSDLLQSQFSAELLGEIVKEAHAVGRRLIAHCHGGPGLRAVVDAGVDSVEHGIFLTRADLALLAQQRIPLVVTLGVYDRLAVEPTIPAGVREKCAEAVIRYRQTLRDARDVGVVLAVGTDTVHGDLVSEMEALVNAGLAAVEALSAATANGAAVCGLSDVGAVRPGMRADLIACEGDPLVDVDAVRRVVHVMQDGAVRW